MSIPVELEAEEIVKLLDVYGHTLIPESLCEDCGEPTKAIILQKLDRMRQLAQLLPDAHDQNIKPGPRLVQ